MEKRARISMGGGSLHIDTAMACAMINQRFGTNLTLRAIREVEEDGNVNAGAGAAPDANGDAAPDAVVFNLNFDCSEKEYCSLYSSG